MQLLERWFRRAADDQEADAACFGDSVGETLMLFEGDGIRRFQTSMFDAVMGS